MSTIDPLDPMSMVQVENLPDDVEEIMVSTFFMARLRIDTCKVTMLRDESGGFTNVAIIDLKNRGMANKAIRELNCTEILGNRVLVSLYLDKQSISRQQCVYISNLTAHWDARRLYDYLSHSGTIVSLDVPWNEKAMEQMDHAFVSFSTVDEARNAMQRMNSMRRHPDDPIVEPFKTRVRFGSTTTIEFAKGDEFEFEGGFGRELGENTALEWEDSNLDSSNVGESLSPRTTQRVLQAIDGSGSCTLTSASGTGSNNYSDKSSTASADQLPETLPVDGNSTTNQSNKPHGSPVCDVSSSLGLAAMSTDEQRKEVLCDHLIRKHMDSISPPSLLNRILRMMQNSFDVAKLIEIAEDAKLFHMYATDAKDAINSGGKSIQPITKAAIELRSRLRLDSMRSVQDKKEALVEELFYRHLDDYEKDKEKFKSLLIALSNSMDVPELLMVATDNDVFSLRLSNLENTSSIEEDLFRAASSAAKRLMIQLGFNQTNRTTYERSRVIRHHLRQIHSNCCAHVPLDCILEVLSNSLDIGEFLEIAIDCDRFHLFAGAAREAAESRASVLSAKAKAVLRLRLQLGLVIVPSIEQGKLVIRNYLFNLYKPGFSGNQLTHVLDVITSKLDIPKLLLLAVDRDAFLQMARNSMRTIEAGDCIVPIAQAAMAIAQLIDPNVRRLQGTINRDERVQPGTIQRQNRRRRQAEPVDDLVNILRAPLGMFGGPLDALDFLDMALDDE